MSKPVNIYAFAALTAAVLPAADETGAWLKIMPAGEWSGRDGRGPFLAGDRAAMQAIVDRTLAYLAGTEMMVDYDHQSAFGAVPGVGGTAPASGWFKRFEVRDDGIYGQVEWTAAAAEQIAAKAYRYISPLFTANQAKRVDRIDNVALTNTPALNLEAIAAAASRFSTEENEAMTLLERLAKALGLDASVSEETLVTTVTAFATDRGRMAEAAGLAKDAPADQVVVAMSTKLSAGSPDPKAFVPMSMFTDLQSQLTAFTASDAEAKATAEVDKAIADGKLPPAQKTWAMSFAQKDLEGFKGFLANQPVLTSRQLKTDAVPKDGDPELSEGDLIAMKATGVSREAFIAARKLEVQ